MTIRYFAVTIFAILAMVLAGSFSLAPSRASAAPSMPVKADGVYATLGTQGRAMANFIFKYYPRHAYVYITSGLRHDGSGSWHNVDRAIDIGSNSQIEKDRLGRWLYQFSGNELELIHT